MEDCLVYSRVVKDPESGCEYREISQEDFFGKIRICHVVISEIQKIATELTRDVQDTSWMHNLDVGAKRAYSKTVAETAHELVEIFRRASNTNKISSEFGELVVSMGAAKALNKILSHKCIPIAELWKPQKKQNEGFDFHTVCLQNLVNFGEAKYSARNSPHGNAINQAKEFVDAEKHLRDRVHLISLVSDQAIENLDTDSFGVVAAFSLNADNPHLVLKNALEKAKERLSDEKIKYVYLVGVTD